MLAMACPHCGNNLQIPEQYAGQVGKCNKCQGAISVPAMAIAVEPPQQTGLDAFNVDLDGPSAFDKPPVIVHSSGVQESDSLQARAKQSAIRIVAALIILFATGYILMQGTFTSFGGSGTSYRSNPVNSVLFGSGGPATLAEFNRLKNGMSYREAVKIIGAEGTVMSSGHMDGVPGVMASVDMVMYTWEGSGGAGANMNAMFQNDRLINKAQFGLQ